MKTYTLITGASQGFGKALAIECALRRMNLVLVSLPNSGQNELRDFLRNNFDVDVFSIETDLSCEKNCIKLFEEVNNRNLSIKYLINNAGVLSQGLFEDLPEGYFIKQINVNVMAPTILTKLFLEHFKRNSPSGILNVSSMASFFNLPKKQVYSGTKAYLLSFSKCLQKELRPYNIWISTVCPGGMNTTTQLCLQNRKLGWLPQKSILNPEIAARKTLKKFLHKKEVIIPGLLNGICLYLNYLLPSFIKNKLTRKLV